jgi:hypothetical protein
MSEWRDPDDIKDDFASGDPERIRIGIAGLRYFTREGDEVELPAIDPALLLPFGDSPPDDTVLDLARLIARYRSFVPQPSRADVIRQLVELAVRYGVSQVIYETSIEIQGEADPADAARAAVAYIGWRGLANPREVEAARKLVGYLLDAKAPVRRAATEALAAWPHTAAKREVIAAVLPQVDPDQRVLLKVGGKA